ncbi:MAG: branched-chain amino acid ABC transporter substrate-binding protein [Chloroflexota bacterium]
MAARSPDHLDRPECLGGLGLLHVLRVAWFIALLTACGFPGTVRPTVKLGLVAPFEGRYRYVGYDVIHGVNLALHEVNQQGGVAGYGIELVAYDDGGDQAMAVEQARKLGVDPAVVGAIGHFRQDTIAAAVRVYGEAGVSLVAPGVLDPESALGQGPVYRLGPTADLLAEAMLDRAAQLAPGGDIVLVGAAGPLAEALQRAAAQSLPTIAIEADGWEREVLVREPSLLLLAADPVPAGEVIAALRSSGWSGRVLGGPALAASDFVAVAGESATGCAFVTPWPFPADVPGGDDFAAAYRRVSNGTEPGPLALPAYNAVWTLLEALEQAAAEGQPTRRGVTAALANAGRSGELGRLTVDGSRQWADLGLYWYRIGRQGAVSLLSEG